MNISGIAAACAGYALFLFTSAHAQGEHYVRGYTKQDGTYVAPHYQTSPNGTRADNWSTRGNVNPYTGEPGMKPLYPSVPNQFPQPAFRGLNAPAPQSSFNQPPTDSSYSQPDPN